MHNLTGQRQERLRKIAEEDNIYQVWAKSYEYYRDDFNRFASSQPDEIRNFLYGFAESGLLMQQRLVNLACEHMKFPDEES